MPIFAPEFRAPRFEFPHRCRKVHLCFPHFRRDGRVVDYSSLENCRTERYRGFESLSLRKQGCKSTSYTIYTLCYTQIFNTQKDGSIKDWYICLYRNKESPSFH